MQRRLVLFPTIMSLLLIIAIVFFGPPTFARAQNGTNPQYHNCRATFSCGNITNIGYPFWGSDRPDYCGHPQFQLNCTDDSAVIKIENLTYQVLAINSGSHDLTVVRTDYVDNICPSSLANTTLNTTYFSYGSDKQDITLYYFCPALSNTSTSPAGSTNQYGNAVITSNETRNPVSPNAATYILPCNATLTPSPDTQSNTSTLPAGSTNQYCNIIKASNETRNLGSPTAATYISAAAVILPLNATLIPSPDTQSNTSTLPAGSTAQLSCNSSNSFYVTRDLGNSTTAANYLATCRTKVVVPATESAVQALERSNKTEQNVAIALEQGFGLQWEANDTYCRTCEASNGLCGTNTADGSFACYCSDQPYSFSCVGSTPGQLSGGKSNGVSLARGLSIAAAAIVGICLVCFYCFTRRRRLRSGNLVKQEKGNKAENKKIQAFITDYQSHMPKQYSYSEIQKMTASFSHKLGQGGFGGVYKGKLPNGRAVAVKVLSMSKGDGEDFINEVASISRTSHVNIVSLLGFCCERNERALIYEYMPNGSLDKFINGEGSQHNKQHLEWKTLYDIAVGIARGLEYLHRGCSTRIVHFDIKPQNILLDEDFCPKVSDFGLAKICKGKQSVVSMTGWRGTIGYIAPEIFMGNFGGVSYKSDVYSFGMMILEMFAGKKNIDVGASRSSETNYFSDWIFTYLQSEKIRTLHEKITDEEEETVRRMIIVGLWCIQTNPSDRPSMTKVVEMLEGSPESLPIPPKPFLFSTTAPPDFSSTLSSTPYVWCQEDEVRVLL